jgi:hypothetical protein
VQPTGISAVANSGLGRPAASLVSLALRPTVSILSVCEVVRYSLSLWIKRDSLTSSSLYFSFVLEDLQRLYII